MDNFAYRDGVLHADDVSLVTLAAEVGTPCYVYSRRAIESQWLAFDAALRECDHLVCYAVKANTNLAVLNVLARLGSGFDIVSAGELARVLKAGGSPDKVIFSGVGKSRADLEFALKVGIYCFNVESESELLRLNEVARGLGKVAPISLRVNPDVDAKTHPYISTGMKENKFGIDIQTALAVYQKAAQLPHIKITGIDCHIGSQLTDLNPFMDGIKRMMMLVERLKGEGITLEHIDVGGGLGIRYRDEHPPSVEAYIQALLGSVGNAGYRIIFEPGRAIVGNAGILLTRVEYLKLTTDKHFAVVDAAMNDLIRPSLYGAWQEISVVCQSDTLPLRHYDVVGPVCETGDFLGKSRLLAIEEGGLLAVQSAGAYGFVMSSNYNSRPRAAEVMVDGGRYQVVRRRETVAELSAGEEILMF